MHLLLACFHLLSQPLSFGARFLNGAWMCSLLAVPFIILNSRSWCLLNFVIIAVLELMILLNLLIDDSYIVMMSSRCLSFTARDFLTTSIEVNIMMLQLSFFFLCFLLVMLLAKLFFSFWCQWCFDWSRFSHLFNSLLLLTSSEHFSHCRGLKNILRMHIKRVNCSEWEQIPVPKR